MTMTIADACTDFGVPRVPAAVLVRMSQSMGRYVETQSLRYAIEAVTGNGATEESVRSAVKILRRSPVLRPRIEACFGVGYRLLPEGSIAASMKASDDGPYSCHPAHCAERNAAHNQHTVEAEK